MNEERGKIIDMVEVNGEYVPEEEVEVPKRKVMSKRNRMPYPLKRRRGYTPLMEFVGGIVIVIDSFNAILNRLRLKL